MFTISYVNGHRPTQSHLAPLARIRQKLEFIFKKSPLICYNRSLKISIGKELLLVINTVNLLEK